MIRTIIAVLLVVLCASVSIAQPQPNQPKKTTKAERHGTEKNPLFVKVVPADDAEAKAQREEQYRRDKAVEDTWMAKSTIWLAGVTTLLAIFTALLWWANLKLVGDSRKAAQAARDSADAVVNANTAHIAPEIKLNRSSFRVQPPGRFRPEINYTFKNYGKSPGTIISFADYLIRLDTLPENPVYPPSATDVDREWVIGDGDESREFPCGLVSNIVNWGTQEMTPEELRAERRPFFLIGNVVYDDVFGFRHFKRYCYRFEFRENGTIAYRPDGGRPYNLRSKEKSPYG